MCMFDLHPGFCEIGLCCETDLLELLVASLRYQIVTHDESLHILKLGTVVKSLLTDDLCHVINFNHNECQIALYRCR